ncbi:hypothetical protein ACJMK2_010146 [Sinanodonta woodiana]|uniref:BED-type domain-containing protein n=1 Tax=Sinanodonta woodiana TaxID=1069815 RepID=A0ABD3VG17_SINWO
MAACAYELVKNTKAKSSVWNRFSLKREFSTNTIDKTVAVCNLCKTEIKHAGSMTKLSTHLWRHQPSILSISTVEQNDSTSKVRAEGSIKSLRIVPDRQPTIADMLGAQTKYRSSSPRAISYHSCHC